jgi:pantothenate kinase
MAHAIYITASSLQLRHPTNHLQTQDGFHYPKSILPTLQNSECAFKRRGAPFTFDAEAFVELVKALRETPVTEVDDHTKSFHAPSFDHAIKDPIENDIYIPSSQRIVILEGNYLLLSESPWDQIQHLVDESSVFPFYFIANQPS